MEFDFIILYNTPYYGLQTISLPSIVSCNFANYGQGSEEAKSYVNFRGGSRIFGRGGDPILGLQAKKGVQEGVLL